MSESVHTVKFQDLGGDSEMLRTTFASSAVLTRDVELKLSLLCMESETDHGYSQMCFG